MYIIIISATYIIIMRRYVIIVNNNNNNYIMSYNALTYCVSGEVHEPGAFDQSDGKLKFRKFTGKQV